MTREEAVAFINRRLELFKRHDSAALAAGHTEDGIVISPIFSTVQGRTAIEASYKSLFTAFPDWDMRGEEPIIDGDRIAQFYHVRATHAAELFGVPGTGKRIDFTCVLLLKIENGLVAHERRVYDFAGVLMQMGVLKGKPARQ